jgi:hypothetical protein
VHRAGRLGVTWDVTVLRFVAVNIGHLAKCPIDVRTCTYRMVLLVPVADSLLTRCIFSVHVSVHGMRLH